MSNSRFFRAMTEYYDKIRDVRKDDDFIRVRDKMSRELDE